MEEEINGSIEENQKKDQPQHWLQRLKEESWEAELLVSTISIFGTFQMFGLIDWWTNMFIDALVPSQYLVGYMIVFFGLVAISVLISMFVIHFFLRAYWIGLVGLNSVFPDYSIEDSAFSPIYTEKYLATLPKLKDSIKKVDDLCSVIFSVAFTFLLSYAYMAILSTLYLWLFNMLSDYINTYLLLIPAILAGFVLVVQLITALIANRKVNWEKEGLQLFLFKINRIANFLMLGPLYKSITQVIMVFASNFKKKKSLIYLMISFLFAGIVVAGVQVSNTNIEFLIEKGLGLELDVNKAYPNYYESQSGISSLILTPQLETDKIESKVVKLFIPIFEHERKLRKSVCEILTDDSSLSRSEQRQQNRIEALKCYHNYNMVLLDGVAKSVEYLKYGHPVTEQFGVICYLDLTNLEPGLHRVSVKKEYGDENNSEWSIPFYYHPSNG